MATHIESLRLRLMSGPQPGSHMAKALGISQPTAARALAAMGDEVIKLGQKKGTRFALRDRTRGFDDVPVYRVDADGKLQPQGVLSPVYPEGFVFTQTDGSQSHSPGLPWWLLAMRPQGFLGRAFAAHHGQALGLPSTLADWSDSHALRALLQHGHDAPGDLLLGDTARERFLTAPEPVPLPQPDKAAAYARMALAASQGEAPGSSAGGEQPKFCAYADTEAGPAHVLVKYSELPDSPVSQRWRDLLLAEHLALRTLHEAGLAAAPSALLEHAGQRFLEVQRFDRTGVRGRRAVHALSALDAEFVGAAREPWPVLVQRLQTQALLTPEALPHTQTLWAFGTLIGNTDMHSGNLSFVAPQDLMAPSGTALQLAPTYDMTPMCFAPNASGKLPNNVPTPALHPSVSPEHWRSALQLATHYLATLRSHPALSPHFTECLQALSTHQNKAREQIERLG